MHTHSHNIEYHRQRLSLKDWGRHYPLRYIVMGSSLELVLDTGTERASLFLAHVHPSCFIYMADEYWYTPLTQLPVLKRTLTGRYTGSHPVMVLWPFSSRQAWHLQRASVIIFGYRVDRWEATRKKGQVVLSKTLLLGSVVMDWRLAGQVLSP